MKRYLTALAVLIAIAYTAACIYTATPIFIHRADVMISKHFSERYAMLMEKDMPPFNVQTAALEEMQVWANDLCQGEGAKVCEELSNK